jgi:molybdopterin synthase sulfur carrier subunit
MKIRVTLPFHLRNLARLNGEVQLDVDAAAPGRATLRETLDALEARYPMLRGTIRDHVTLQRRPFLRYFACQKDMSLDRPDTPLPEAVLKGQEPFIVRRKCSARNKKALRSSPKGRFPKKLGATVRQLNSSWPESRPGGRKRGSC